MIKQLTLIVAKKLWLPSLIVLMFNLLIFSNAIEKGQFSLASDRSLVVWLAFFVQNTVYALLMFWPKGNVNLVRQLIEHRRQVFLHFLPVFLLLSITVQLVPVLAAILVFPELSEINYVSVLQGIFLWFYGFTGFGIGYLISKWRKLSFAVAAFGIPYYVTVLVTSSNVLVAFVLALIFLIAICIYGKPALNRFGMATLMSLGCFILLFMVTYFVFPKEYLSSNNFGDQDIAATYGEDKTPLRRHDFWITPWQGEKHLFFRWADPRVDWLNKTAYLVTNPSDNIKNKSVKTFQEFVSEQWKNNHSNYVPLIEQTYLGENLVVFPDAIYGQGSSESNHRIWRGGEEKSLISWVSRFNYYQGQSLFLYGSENNFNWVYSDKNGAQHLGTMDIEGIPIKVVMSNYVEQQDKFLLVINTNNYQQYIFQWQDFTTSPELIEVNALPVNQVNAHTVKNGISITLNWLDSLLLDEPQNVVTYHFSLIFWVSHVLAVIVLLLYFSRDSVGEKIAKSLFVLILAWPGLLALILCFPKQKQPDWQVDSVVQH